MIVGYQARIVVSRMAVSIRPQELDTAKDITCGVLLRPARRGEEYDKKRLEKRWVLIGG